VLPGFLDHYELQHRLSHYVDLWSAFLGLTLLPVGYLCHALTKRPRLNRRDREVDELTTMRKVIDDLAAPALI
jgi:hypothetical protein